MHTILTQRHHKQLLSEWQLQMSAANHGEQPEASSETGYGSCALFQRTSSAWSAPATIL